MLDTLILDKLSFSCLEIEMKTCYSVCYCLFLCLQGWTMVFKAVTGANRIAQKAYRSAETYAENEMAALDATNKHPNDYKNSIVFNWGQFGASEVSRIKYN